MFDEGNATHRTSTPAAAGRPARRAADAPLVQNADGTFVAGHLDRPVRQRATRATARASSACSPTSRARRRASRTATRTATSRSSARCRTCSCSSDPAKDGSYMNRSKYTEKFIAQNILNLPEFAGSADTHFDSVRPMNHAYVIPAGYTQKATADDTAAAAGRARTPTQTNVWSIEVARRVTRSVEPAVAVNARRPRRSLHAKREETQLARRPAWRCGAAACGRLGGSRTRAPARRSRGADARAAAGAGRAEPRPPRSGRRCSSTSRSRRRATMSCATCHDPDHAYGPPNDLAVQLGGAARRPSGHARRAVAALQGVHAGLRRPARQPRRHQRAGPGRRLRLGRPRRHAGRAGRGCRCSRPSRWRTPAPRTSSRKVARGAYADRFRAGVRRRGAGPTPTRAFDDGARALQAFQLEDPSFHPYTSKFDLHAGNKIGGDVHAPPRSAASRSSSTRRRGNCASCHYHGAGLNGSSGLFTDFSYEAIGVPRNRSIPANADPQHFDLGLCGPLRTDHLPARGHRTRSAGCSRRRRCATSPTRQRVLPQRRDALARAGDPLLQHATRPELWYPTAAAAEATRPVPGYGLVTTQYAGDGPEVRRPARRVPREHRPADAARRPRARARSRR